MGSNSEEIEDDESLYVIQVLPFIRDMHALGEELSDDLEHRRTYFPADSRTYEDGVLHGRIQGMGEVFNQFIRYLRHVPGLGDVTFDFAAYGFPVDRLTFSLSHPDARREN